jgi:glycosyltransferase involved in cell wall biosynthesis
VGPHPSANSAEDEKFVLITVAICTFNRAESLRRTLDSLVAMRVPGDVPWEMVVVNNNSTDHTDDVISEYVGRLPVRREFEPRTGKSNALNRAIDVARGDYILWTDDDVLVDPGWLTAYVEAFRRWPEAAVFGGRITPRYDPPPAKWLIQSETVLVGPYAIRDFGDQAQPLCAKDEDRFPFGANWAMRAIEQRAFRYDPNLGPVPNRIRNQEESDLIYRVLKSGATGYWIPEARVEHCIGRIDRRFVISPLIMKVGVKPWPFVGPQRPLQSRSGSACRDGYGRDWSYGERSTASAVLWRLRPSGSGTWRPIRGIRVCVATGGKEDRGAKKNRKPSRPPDEVIVGANCRGKSATAAKDGITRTC